MLKKTGYVCVRDDGDHEFFLFSEIEPLPSLAEVAARKTNDECGPGYGKTNRIVRVAMVEIQEVPWLTAPA